jgi:hypothetical protein
MRVKFLIGFLFFAMTLSAQESVDSLRAFYVQEYPDKFSIWPVLKYRTLTFGVSDKHDRDKSVTFKPNNTASLGFGFYLFEVVFELTLAVPVNEEQKNIFGESKARDLQVNILTKSWGIDIYHQKYSGFYRDDLRESGPINGPSRADIDSRNFGVSGLYAFNHRKFSLRSSYNYAERQLRSRGSFILYATINSFKTNADSALLTEQVRETMSKGSDLEDIKCTTLSIAPGYSYNLVAKKFFLNGTLTVGPAHHWVYYQSDSGEKHYDVSFNATTTLRLALGYNSNRFFGGLGFVVQSRAVKFENVRFENASSTFKFLIGCRFAEKGILKKKAWEFLPRLN